MSRKTWASVLTLCLVLGLAAVRLFSAEDAKKDEKKEIKYKGSKQCITCHQELDDSVDMWMKTKHSKAFEVLASDEAKKLSEDPQNDPKCLECHTTGYGKTGGFVKDMDDKKKEGVLGVTCESCHGPGADYSKIMMKAKMSGAYDKDAAAAAGLLTPNTETCLGCHNDKNPTFKEGEFKPEEAIKTIAHGKKLEKKD